MATVTIDEAAERIYKITEIEELLRQLEDTGKRITALEKECNALKTERRLLYQDVKKIHEIIPIDTDGKVNMMKLPRVINSLTQNPNAIKAFTGLTDFVQKYEKNNLIVITK
ncbi:MAG: hypothetical protein KIS94_05640 [Chitinophagales bacterium]|nr:hypothetical protein [Chitinophagales bacterium]